MSMLDHGVHGLLAGVLALAACDSIGEDTSDDEAATDSTGETSTGETSTGETSTTDTDAEPLAGVCKLGCKVPADCCPVGAIDCPGDYPNDWQCQAGSCALLGCQLDAQCMRIGNFPDHECHPIAGSGSCFDPCESDADCLVIPGATCSGMADDDARFCQVDAACRVDADCAGQGICELATGACGCNEDADCSAPGLVCVVD